MSKFLRLQKSNYSHSPINEKCKSHKTGITSCLRDGSTKFFDFIVIGSGVAGLRYALEVAKHGSVAVITKAEPHESNTNYAQGGVSAVLCPLDSIESHMQDTIIAGAYLCDEETVRVSFKTENSINVLIFSKIFYKICFIFSILWSSYNISLELYAISVSKKYFIEAPALAMHV